MILTQKSENVCKTERDVNKKQNGGMLCSFHFFQIPNLSTIQQEFVDLFQFFFDLFANSLLSCV